MGAECRPICCAPHAHPKRYEKTHTVNNFIPNSYFSVVPIDSLPYCLSAGFFTYANRHDRQFDDRIFRSHFGCQTWKFIQKVMIAASFSSFKHSMVNYSSLQCMQEHFGQNWACFGCENWFVVRSIPFAYTVFGKKVWGFCGPWQYSHCYFWL